MERIQAISDAATAKTKNDIRSKLARVDGFLEVPSKKKEIAIQLTEVLAKDEDMKVVAAKCEELMKSGVLPDIKKDNYNEDDEE